MDDESDRMRQIAAELRGSNKEKRLHAVMRLGTMRSESSVKMLISVLENTHQEIPVRARAALMLGLTKSQSAVFPLLQALDANGYSIKVNAAKSLGKVGNCNTIDRLINHQIGLSPTSELYIALTHSVREIETNARVVVEVY